MKDFLRIKELGPYENVNDYLERDWEVIEAVKVDGEIKYHIGLSARTMAMKYEAIIKEYERFGFKEKLFEKIAENYGANLNDYEQSGWHSGVDEMSKFMTNYDKTVEGEHVIEYGLSQRKIRKNVEVDTEDLGF